MALLVASGVYAVVAAPPANAAATATVMAQTQRMSGPSLHTRQDGWYRKGQKLTLACYERGQAVKGYFSSNIPNGGWDNLWYRVSDGHYVADVDIQTGSLQPVTGKCAQPQTTTPAPSQSGGLRWPVANPVVTQDFGVNPELYRQYGMKGHNGIDLRAAVGTPVYAAGSGVVTFAGSGHPWMGAEAGNCILLKHNGFYTGYAHLSQIKVRNGQQVSKGQLIGLSGESGAAYGPHLHFEVLKDPPNWNNGYKGRVNPRNYLGH